MPEKCRRINYALIVTVFAVFLWMMGCESDMEVTGKNIGESMAQIAGSAEKTVSLEQSDIPKTEIVDLTDAFSVILERVSKETIGGYAVDESFLMWFYSRYGKEAVIQVAFDLLDGDDSPDIWYRETGNSIHVLWLLYCQDSGFKPDSLNHVYWKETSDPSEIVFGFVGDINFADDWCTTEYMKKQPNGFEDCFSDELLTQMKNVDVMVVNNEFTYAKADGARALQGKAYTFRAEPETVDLLDYFGTDLVSLANNHVYDYGKNGLVSTLECLEKKGILYSGAGRNMDEASKIIYYVMNGRKIAYVSATQIERMTQYTKEATKTEPGVLKTLDPEHFLQVVHKAASTSDYVIAEVHWGTEGTLYPDASQKNLANQIASAGADVIIGGHPHRLQSAGFVGNVPVAYSIGNFWFSTGTLYTTLAKVTIREDGEVKLSFVPCVQENLKTRMLTDSDETDGFYRYLAAISSQIGIDRDGMIYNKNSSNYPYGQIPYDSDTSTTEITGFVDNEGKPIDIVGNLEDNHKSKQKDIYE